MKYSTDYSYLKLNWFELVTIKAELKTAIKRIEQLQQGWTGEIPPFLETDKNQLQEILNKVITKMNTY